MPSSATPLRGRTGLFLTLKDGSSAAVAVADDVRSWSLTPGDAEGDDLTFFEAAQGAGETWTLSLTGQVAHDTGSLWSTLWSLAGKTVDYVLGPHGNTAAAANKPHFTGKVTIKTPGMENEARTAKTRAPFTVAMECDEKPTLKTS